MPPSPDRLDVVHFGVFQADFRSGELRKAGVRVKLHDQPLQVLAMLVARPGELVTRDEFRKRLWPDDSFVDFDHGLNNAVGRLREALGDSADTPRFVETLPRKGYRFIAPINLQPEPALAASSSESSPRGIETQFKFSKRALIALVVSGAAVLAIAIAIVVIRRPQPPQVMGPQPIAVLPLENTSAAKDLDFLRIGLADDIANTLSYYPAFSIRPFATSNRYAGVDLQKAAREMRVGRIITGHFAVAGNEVEITLEAVDAANNRVLWRDTLRGPVRDLTGVQQQIAIRVQHGLLTALGVTSEFSASSNTSHNAEAYELYLRAMSEDFAPSQSTFSSQIKEAIHLLQRAVVLDPSYSSAWAALGHLYYYDITFGDGGKAARLNAKAALQRAVALDPRRIDAASDLITMESEEGNLNQAYDEIIQLLQHRPESGAAHLVYSYVLWYGGLLDEAAAECEKTRSLDAGTTDLASCFHIFMALGRYDRAREYLQLQSGTEFAKGGDAEILLREGKQNQALQELKTLPTTPLYGLQLLEPCLNRRPMTATESIAVQQMRSEVMAADDPLPKYLFGAWEALCDQPDHALSALRMAISQNYCAYPQMETDPLLAKLRATPGFAEIRSLGIACQQRFLEHKNSSHVTPRISKSNWLRILSTQLRSPDRATPYATSPRNAAAPD